MSSDLQIQRDVIEELEWEPAVNSEYVRVEVQYGIVTLSGSVGSYAEKLHAESAAHRAHGVKALAMAIEVRLPLCSKRTDAEIACSVNDLLSWTVYLPIAAVQVTVEGGWVTLTGRVEWDYPRRLAMNVIRSLAGVTGVSDETVIKPSVALSAIKSVIEAALRRRPDTHLSAMAVDVQGSDGACPVRSARGSNTMWAVLRSGEHQACAAWSTTASSTEKPKAGFGRGGHASACPNA